VRKREGGVEVERSLRAVARMSNALRVGLAGFVATAVAYGPARTGYGLFVPDFRGEFGLSTGAAGAIGSGL
jgi:hypothetical protein